MITVGQWHDEFENYRLGIYPDVESDGDLGCWISDQKTGAGCQTFRNAVDAGPVILVPLSRALLAMEAALVAQGLLLPEATTLAQLACWRNADKASYPDDPPVVDAGTYSWWLELDYFANDLRLDWLLVDPRDYGALWGTLGARFDRQGYRDWEVDSVLGNPHYRRQGHMTDGLRAITAMVGGDSCAVHPRPDNEVGINWYSRRGFEFVPGKVTTLKEYGDSLYEMRLRLPMEVAIA